MADFRVEIRVLCGCGAAFYVPRVGIGATCPRCLEIYFVSVSRVFADRDTKVER